MLTHIDRIQLVVANRSEVGALWERLLGAETAREDVIGVLGAKRTVLAVGSAEVELLEPEGSGPVASFMGDTGRGGLFAAGFATQDIDALRAHLQSHGASVSEEHGQLFVGEDAVPGGGLRSVITAEADRERVGLMTRFHEVSFLVEAPEVTAPAIVETFGLDGAHFGEAQSDAFGFQGVHAFLTAARRDDVETIHPVNPENAMGRFFARRGPSLYMSFGESDQMEQVRARAMEHAPEDWTGPREGPVDSTSIFLHPRALGGVMLGVRPSTD